jgi:uncharacterized integral membrane protein
VHATKDDVLTRQRPKRYETHSGRARRDAHAVCERPALGMHPPMSPSTPAPATDAIRRERAEQLARGPTRASWAWLTVIIGLVLGIALVDFLVQNTQSARIEFFSATGRVPVSVALLAAALAGAAVVVVVGIARMVQLRRGNMAGHPRSPDRHAQPDGASVTRSVETVRSGEGPTTGTVDGI